SEWEDKYAKVYDDLDVPDNDFVVDFLVISEFVNRAMRLSYDIYLDEKGFNSREIPFKDYRNSTDGKETLSDIYELVKELLKHFTVIEKSYSKIDIESMTLVDNLDFTDKAIVKICEVNNYILLTNDGDYKYSNIDIITCNSYLVT
ncbi:hypothetical protein, partial [Poseidonibacter sp.]|uniref:hypothetical protein n=1 Tax=Poseidonibacter sp. TaxID=2321188 RepID=UPI003C7863B5